MITEQDVIATLIGIDSVLIVALIVTMYSNTMQRRRDYARRLGIIGRGGSDKLEL